MRVLVMAAGFALLAAALPPSTRGFAIRGSAWSDLTDTTVCPLDRPDARRVVADFFTKTPNDRTDLGIALADTANVRVLTDSTDAAACQWFRAEITLSAEPPRDWVFYKVGAFYFISIVHAPQCNLCLRHDGLAIFDSTFTLRKALGM